MFRILKNVLSESEVNDIVGFLTDASFVDGAATANGQAEKVKNNEQLDNVNNKALIEQITKKVIADRRFKGFAMPVEVMPVTISRYVPGMEYGTHMDKVFMGEMRTDLSFTLFLSDPDSYDGGELVVETELGEQQFKLPAGSMILYPSARLHRVNPVTRGTRLAALSWVQSLIANTEKRELCIELEQAMNTLAKQHGWDGSIDKLNKVSNNLRRLWGKL